MLNTKALAASASAAKIYVEDVFSTWLYTGNGSTQTITNGIDLSGEGGLVWIKSRSGTYGSTSHILFDTARGVNKYINTNSTSKQDYLGAYTDLLTSFGSTGFTLGSGSSLNWTNSSSTTYASWTFRKAEKFFDVVTYTGTGSARTVAHNLGSTPGCIIVKRTDSADNWTVYHTSLGNTKYLELNQTAAAGTDISRWNNTTPTSTVFTVGTDAAVNASGGTYVAYLFAHDAGGFGASGNDSVVSCGSFSVPGTGIFQVNLGWEPQWILFKGTNTLVTPNWYVVDTMRGTSYSKLGELYANTSDAESTAAGATLVPNPTGFEAVNSFLNSDTYIYIAIRRGPMKTPTDATKVFSTLAFNGSTGTSRTVGFPLDLNLQKARDYTYNSFGVSDRLRGFKESSGTGTSQLYTASTAAETTANAASVFEAWNTTRKDGAYNNIAANIEYNFRRAPGYFDAVCYTGTGSARTVSHNLGVAPELIITKTRSLAGSSWGVDYVAPNLLGFLNSDTSFSSGILWNNGVTATSIGTTATGAIINQSSATYIAYLFATCPGVSKVGSYTGTGTTKDIDCGFTNGARFVLIKRTDSTGDWYVWDTARGIVSGNDPYLLLNSTAAENTSTDYIDPLSSGFQISSTAPAAINANGGSYIFLAIA